MNFPQSLPEFQKCFPNEEACRDYLESLKWPEGFTCPTCDHKAEPYRFDTRSSCVLRCKKCKKNASLTAGTVMHGSHTPLMTWFWGAYLTTTQTPGMSALQFQRQLGLSRYETAYQILHKLRSGMVRPDRDQIGGEYPVEVDETFVGGATVGEGHGVHHKVCVIAAIEVRTRKADEDMAAQGNEQHRDGKPVKRKTYAGRLRLTVVPDRSGDELCGFVERNVLPGTEVRTDGWEAYKRLEADGYSHSPLVMAGPDKGGKAKRNDEHLPIVHLVFSNLKAWLNGTHHGVSHQHLQAYLNEYAFRFNRRFYPMVAFNSVLGISSHMTPPTYASLYSGEWTHKAA